MRQFFLKIGALSSYIYPYRISLLVKRIRNTIYTGWRMRSFNKFEGYITGHVEVRGGKHISVEKNSTIENGVRLIAVESRNKQSFSPTIIIGHNTIIQRNCFLSAINRIEIGNHVGMAEHTVVIDNVHGDYRAGHMDFTLNDNIPDVLLQNVEDRDLVSAGPVVIEDNVHIGMYSVIMPGVTVGHNSVINAHSVVTRNVPPYSIVSGNPAKVVLSFNA